MIVGRKGEEEGSAHLLILIIALMLILLVLFLPPEDRAALLESDTTIGSAGTPATGTSSPGSPFLIEKSVGKLEFYPPEGFEHFLPGMHIFQARNAVVLHKIPSFEVKNNWFISDKEQVEFTLDDLDNLKNVLLAFDIPYAKGSLTVIANGEQVYEGPISGSVGPVDLPSYLLKRENVVEFMVSSVGGAFWRTNKISMQNVRVIGDLTDVSRTQASTVFTISPTEKDNLISATLVFIAECDDENKGLLSVQLNGQSLSSAVVECGIPTKQNVPLDMLNSGTNTIVFSTDRGDYRIEQAKIDTDLKDVRSFVEYFELEPRDFDRVTRGPGDVVLEIDFVDNGKRKRGQLNINGHLTFIDQTEPFYTRSLKPYVAPGPRNYIEIIPETPLDIVQVRVRLR